MTYIKSKKIQIYGIIGTKGSGKDSFAKLVKEYNNNFEFVRFADDLKFMTHKIFDFPLEYMESQEEKAKKFNIPVDMDKYLPSMIQYTGLPLQNKKILAYSLREILQYFGSEYVRDVCDTYWVDRVIDKIKRLKNKVLVTDCRFLNEANALKKVGGLIIRIDRLDKEENNDLHISEQELMKIEPDIILGTLTNKFSLQKRVAYLIAWNKDQYISKFDYSKVRVALDKYSNGGSLEEFAIELGVHNHDTKVFYALMDYYNIKPRTKGFESHKFENGIEVKKCGRCTKFLSLDNFGLSSRSWDMLYNYCKNCRTNYSGLNKTNTLEKIYKNTKKNAGYRNIIFDLSIDDINELQRIQNNKCFYSGVEMSTEVNLLNKITIDRVNSKIGYIKSNIVLCSYIVNMMKNKLSIDEFIKWINLIVDNGFKWNNLKTDELSVDHCVKILTERISLNG